MKQMTLAIMAVLAALPAAAGQAPEVDKAEVLRLGNLAQHVDGIGGDPVDPFVEAMGPPASDADKWFITVLSMRGCAACEQIKRDWTTDPWLLALADPNDPAKSWAHYNVYYREDASQAFRFERLQVTAFPTIVVQPPRSGRYGKPETIVFQGTYGGDPQRLARQITTAIRKYVSKFEATPQVPAHRSKEEAIGIDPPWQPVPRVDPRPSVTPVLPDGRPLIPPDLEPADSPATGSWGTAFTLAGTSLVTLLLAVGVPWLLRMFRRWRIESGRQTLLSDEQFQRLLEALRAGGSFSSASASPSESSNRTDGSPRS
ncbi:MAG: hypothetical protein WBC44_02850 [Planctomycetaceae bacterium]